MMKGIVVLLGNIELILSYLIKKIERISLNIINLLYLIINVKYG
jgi:hypothetical protein